MPPRVALVDLDDTLIDYRAEEDHAVEALRGDVAGDLPAQVWRSLYRDAKQVQRSHQPLPGPATYRHRFEVFGDRLRDHHVVRHRIGAAELERRYWQARYAAVTPLDGAGELLGVLGRRYDDVVVCTVGLQARQQDRLRIAGLASLVTGLVSSEVAGVGKDDWPRFLGSRWDPGARYLAISDALRPDLFFAAEVGMTTAWIASSPAPRSEFAQIVHWQAPTPAALAVQWDGLEPEEIHT